MNTTTITTMNPKKDNTLLKAFAALNVLPGGNIIFTKGVCLKAPYFSTINPKIVALRKNYCHVEMPMRRSVQNHIKTVHAIAMCNLAELTMGVVAEASIPKHLRWLPKSMDVQYLAKAESDLYATSELEANCWESAPNVPLTVNIFDKNHREVTRAIIQLWVTEKK